MSVELTRGETKKTTRVRNGFFLFVYLLSQIRHCRIPPGLLLLISATGFFFVLLSFPAVAYYLAVSTVGNNLENI